MPVRDDVVSGRENKRMTQPVTDSCHWLHNVSLSPTVTVTLAVNESQVTPCRSPRSIATVVRRALYFSGRQYSAIHRLQSTLLSPQGHSALVSAMIQKSFRQICKIGGNRIEDLATREKERVFTCHHLSSAGNEKFCKWIVHTVWQYSTLYLLFAS